MERIVDREPSQRRGRTFGPGCIRTLRRQHEPQVGVLVRRFAIVCWHGHDDDMPQRRIRPRLEVRQTCLLETLAQDNGQWITLAGIAMAADLQPGLLSLMPSQQHPPGRGMHDES